MSKQSLSFKHSCEPEPERQSGHDNFPRSHKEPFRVSSTKNDVSDCLVVSKPLSPTGGGKVKDNPIWPENDDLQEHYMLTDTYGGKHRYDNQATWSVEEEKRLVRKVGFHTLLL